MTVNICWNLTGNKAASLSVRHELPVWESARASLIWSVMADRCGRGLIIVVGRAFLQTGHGHTSLLGGWFALALAAANCREATIMVGGFTSALSDAFTDKGFL